MQGLYPLSTQDGKAIPLDVVRPQSLVKYDFLGNVSADIVIPAGFGLCYIWATRDCVLALSAYNLPNGLVAGTSYTNAIFIPGQKAMTLMLAPGEASLLGGANAGSIYISSVEQWAAMLQSKQVSVG